MELENTFTVPVPVEEAWPVLLDVQRVAPCMPGATLESVDGDRFDGKVKVKVGPVVVTYKGTAEFLEKDEAAHRVVIAANGKEARGAGTARATVTAQLHPHETGTEVTVLTDLAITGKPAQFGRGVMADVSNAIIGQFAQCLAADMASGGARAEPGAASPATPAGDAEPAGPAAQASPAEPDAAASPVASEPPSARPAYAAPEVLDLMSHARGPLLKRAAPALAALAALVLLVGGLRRRRG
ncbi:MAG TPA: SRPBCC domain-containing protein [Mycobacteriales bacterium]|jgi:carbon monoxide dehydrogenase subunit G|nr:SRPBCC domain-containing protein [Mycobacteriales bacterium]